MFEISNKLGRGMILVCGLLASGVAMAQAVNLMKGVEPRPGETRLTKVDAFKKKTPWTIGMSHFGVNANTWTVQMAHESEGAAAQDKRITKFIMLDANINQAKQVSDIEDLIAQKVDAIIVTPLTPTSADAGIAKAIAAGIPVIVHTGLTDTDKYTVDIQGGGENFGKVMGDWLVKELGGKGNIWVLRGLPAHPEDINRYKGLEKSLKGTNVKIIAEDTGSWQYDNGKKLCETFYLKNPKVDGIWSSGADMTRACIDVFEQFGAKVPPITGEGNNGFFGMWVSKGVRSISAEYGPEQGAAGVRAAVALLEGKALHKRYVYEPAGWDVEKSKKAHRADLSANVWFPTSLSEKDLQKYYGKK
jgi:ribose transport system substrate-binding protein